jgi:hypothetical protein
MTVPSQRRPLIATLVGLVALAFLFQALGASRHHSLTWDEPSFIAGGFAYLTRGDFRFNPGHPPLMQVLAGAPLALSGARDPGRSYEEYAASGNPVVLFGRALVFGSGFDIARLALFSRLPALLFGTLLVLAAYFYGRRMYSPAGALVGAGLCAFCPNLLAHGGLATEDVGCAFLMFVAVWSFQRVAADVQSSRWRDWLLCGALTGLAFSSKYTGLLLVPIYGILAAICWRASGPAWKRGLLGALVVAACATIVVGLSYGRLDGPLLYARGVGSIYSDLEVRQEALLLGSWAQSRWYYYPVALALKTPLPTLALIVAGAGTLLADKSHRRAAAFVLVPPAVVIAVSMFDPVNLGVRRVLPALPFLYLAAAAAADRIVKTHRRSIIAVLGVALAWAFTEVAWIYPNHLSYFSAVAGGPSRGYNLLDDSNIDWGQDLPALAAWQRDHPDAQPLYLAYFGTAVPSAYGVSAVPAPPIETNAPQPPGTYAMSVKMLQTMRRESARFGRAFDWLSVHEPIGRAGYSILIYRFP